MWIDQQKNSTDAKLDIQLAKTMWEFSAKLKNVQHVVPTEPVVPEEELNLDKKVSKTILEQKLLKEEVVEDPDLIDLLLKIRDLDSNTLWAVITMLKPGKFITTKEASKRAKAFFESLNKKQQAYLRNGKVDLEGFRKAAKDREMWIEPQYKIELRTERINKNDLNKTNDDPRWLYNENDKELNLENIIKNNGIDLSKKIGI